MRTKSHAITLVLTIALGAIVGSAQGQFTIQRNDNEDDRTPQQQAEDRFRELLEVSSDEEWAVLMPRIEQAIGMQIQVRGSQNSRISAALGRRLRNVRFTANSPAAEEVRWRQQELDRAVNNPLASNNELRLAIQSLRQAQAAAEAELEAAQKALIALLTVRQEAILIRLGVLD